MKSLASFALAANTQVPSTTVVTNDYAWVAINTFNSGAAASGALTIKAIHRATNATYFLVNETVAANVNLYFACGGNGAFQVAAGVGPTRAIPFVPDALQFAWAAAVGQSYFLDVWAGYYLSGQPSNPGQ